MLDPKPLTGAREGEGFVAASVAGHDAIDGDAEVAIIGDGLFEEGYGTFLFLVWEDVDAGDAGVVVDGDVCELPSDATSVALSVPVASDAMAGPAEFAEFFDVDVDDLAGRFALVAGPWLCGFKRRQQAQSAAGENARDGGSGEAALGGDVVLRAALTAQGLDGIAGCGGGLARR